MKIFEPISKIYENFPLLLYRKGISQNALVRYSPNLVRMCKNKSCENTMRLFKNLFD